LKYTVTFAHSLIVFVHRPTYMSTHYFVIVEHEPILSVRS